MDIVRPHGYNRCTAKSKQSGERCRRDSTVGRNVCYIHGGKTLQGVAHPNYKHGRSSKTQLLPPHLKEHAQDILNNTNYLSLHEDIAIADSLIYQALQDWLTHNSKADIEAAILAQQEVIHQLSTLPNISISTIRHSTLVLDTLTHKLQTYSYVEAVQQAQLHKSRLIDTERRTIEAHEGRLDKVQTIAFMDRLVDILSRLITDRTMLNTVVLEIQSLSPGEGRGGVTDR